MNRDELFTYHDGLFRNPVEVAAAPVTDKKALRKSLHFKADNGFVRTLFKLGITLIISREYEHLLIALHSDGKKITQTFFPLPHPSGIAVKHNKVYVASTRNPNKIVEFIPSSGEMNRLEDKNPIAEKNILTPARIKIYAGAYYFHDLAFIGDELYANSVGQNALIKPDFGKAGSDDIIWQPDIETGKDLKAANYLQLNSIAAGRNVEESCFSASVAIPQRLRPGNPRFDVDGKGVIFNGKSKIVATGLTRPHSARFADNKLWVCNSGYGGLGFIDDGKYVDFKTFAGWTRGLHFRENIAFTGISRILKRFENYAPGLNPRKAISAIVATDINTGKETGRIEFPSGNQIFAIESIPGNITNGFIFNNIQTDNRRIKSFFYKYKT